MSILTGSEIMDQMWNGNIKIDPFPEKVNPNSVNLRLGPRLLVYETRILDPQEEPITREVMIPETGLVLEPMTLYLAETLEYTETRGYVPKLEGRSSIGRLGLFIHVTAGYGDVGFCGRWTCELVAVQPIVVRPGMSICQISYHTIEGEILPYSGKYQGAMGVQASRLWMEGKP